MTTTAGWHWRRPAGRRPWIFGHRGARAHAPENTLRGFDLARQHGADGVELDVRLSGSGEIIVLHDTTLSRLIPDAPDAPVETLPAHVLESARIDDEPIPNLRDVLAWARDTDMRLNVELKHDLQQRPALVQRVVALLGSEPHADERILLSSFYPPFVAWLARALPHVACAWLVHRKQRVLRHTPGWRLLGAAGVHPEGVLCHASQVARLRAAGAFVNTWTINDPARAKALVEMGIDGLITDDPKAIVAALTS